MYNGNKWKIFTKNFKFHRINGKNEKCESVILRDTVYIVSLFIINSEWAALLQHNSFLFHFIRKLAMSREINFKEKSWKVTITQLYLMFAITRFIITSFDCTKIYIPFKGHILFHNIQKALI